MSDCTAPRHGNESAYRQGCRCADAREEKRLVEKRRRHNTHQPAYVPVDGTARRLQALAAIGWSIADLAPRLNTTVAALQQVRRGVRETVRRDLADRARDLYEHLSATPGDAELVRSRAAAWGWAPPLLWHDRNIDDPNARPARDEPAPQRGLDLGEVRFLESFGLSRDTVASRLGVAPGSIERAEYRAQERARNAVERAREAIRAATQPAAFEADPTSHSRELEHAR